MIFKLIHNTSIYNKAKVVNYNWEMSHVKGGGIF
jgi:hypothetical protein